MVYVFICKLEDEIDIYTRTLEIEKFKNLKSELRNYHLNTFLKTCPRIAAL